LNEDFLDNFFRKSLGIQTAGHLLKTHENYRTSNLHWRMLD